MPKKPVILNKKDRNELKEKLRVLNERILKKEILIGKHKDILDKYLMKRDKIKAEILTGYENPIGIEIKFRHVSPSFDDLINDVYIIVDERIIDDADDACEQFRMLDKDDKNVKYFLIRFLLNLKFNYCYITEYYEGTFQNIYIYPSEKKMILKKELIETVDEMRGIHERTDIDLFS